MKTYTKTRSRSYDNADSRYNYKGNLAVMIVLAGVLLIAQILELIFN